MKRLYSFGFTDSSQTQDTIFDDNMPYAKRAKSSGKYGGKRKYSGRRTAAVPRLMSANTCIIPRTADYGIGFGADPAISFGFSASNLWINGSSGPAIQGFGELSGLFELMRVVKVEVTWVPGCQGLDWSNNTITTGTRNIPYVYECFDPAIHTTPSLGTMREAASTVVHTADKPFRRTIYPVLEDGEGVIDVGRSRATTFVRSGIDVPFNGWSVVMDLENQPLTYDIGKIFFKIYYECRASK